MHSCPVLDSHKEIVLQYGIIHDQQSIKTLAGDMPLTVPRIASVTRSVHRTMYIPITLAIYMYMYVSILGASKPGRAEV